MLRLLDDADRITLAEVVKATGANRSMLKVKIAELVTVACCNVTGAVEAFFTVEEIPRQRIEVRLPFVSSLTAACGAKRKPKSTECGAH